MTTHDAEWTPNDREMALQWRTEKDLQCTGCGHPRDESMADEHDAPTYQVEALQCHACRSREETVAKFVDRKCPPEAGVYFPVKEG